MGEDLSRPVQLILDKNGYLIRVGDLSNPDREVKKEIIKAVSEGGEVKQMTIGEYQKAKDRYPWVWDKPKNP